MEEQVKQLQKGVTHIGVGTPGRISALIDRGKFFFKLLFSHALNRAAYAVVLLPCEFIFTHQRAPFAKGVMGSSFQFGWGP